MKPGRNDPCPCGSGKKYKKCCIFKQDVGNLEDELIAEDDELDGIDIPDDILKDRAMMARVMASMQRLMLGNKPHIKEYERIRKLHQEVVSAMAQYYHDGHFEQKPMVVDEHQQPGDYSDDDRHLLNESDFDIRTREGSQVFYDILIYKNSPNLPCITEVFLQKHRYRREDKIEFLHSMLSSKLGLFEVLGTDSKQGYAFLRDVFTGEKYTITDIALSADYGEMDSYMYTRLIEYRGVCFGTGLSLPFLKSDPFIKDFIRIQKKDYKPEAEFQRFIQLYNQYVKNPNNVGVINVN